jgi:lipopolysaccharide export LptBFGC system permease protein LptF
VNGPQLAVAVLSVLIASMIAVVVAYHPGRARKITYPILCVCAALSIYAWCDVGRFLAISADASRSESGPSR